MSADADPRSPSSGAPVVAPAVASDAALTPAGAAGEPVAPPPGPLTVDRLAGVASPPSYAAFDVAAGGPSGPMSFPPPASGPVAGLPPEPTFSLDAVPPERRGPLTGLKIADRYLIKEKIGEGGMGVVYRAEHTLMRKELAVKVLLPQFSCLESVVRRFQREAQSASRLDHPNIVHINDFGRTSEGQLFLALEYLPGRSLTDVIRTEAPLPPARAVRIALQLCQALDHAHALGVVHRDLKPDNVMVLTRHDGEEYVKILDFGIAKITEGDGSAEALTEAGMVFGTPEYLSPEQAAGQEADHRADLYALGLILYEMLAGRRPFTAKNKLELLGKHLSERPEPLRVRSPELDLPAALDQAVMKALEKLPDDRWSSGAELYQALLALELPDVLVAPVSRILTLPPSAIIGRVPPPRPWRRYALYASAGAVVLAVVIGLGVWLGRGRSAKPAAPGPGTDQPMAALSSNGLAPDPELTVVQKLLADGNYKDARVQLESLTDRFPTDARLHLAGGHLYFLKEQPTECLRAFREAIRLDPALKANEQIQRHLVAYLQVTKGRDFGWKQRQEALEFVERYLDGTARAALTEFANTWWEHDTVWRTAEHLRRHGADQDVQWPHVYELAFRSVQSCAKRKQHLEAVVKRRDRRFLPLLKTMARTTVWKGKWSTHHVSNACLKTELAEAIAALEALPETLPAPPAMNP
jgi:serine/threonine-protein kinase